MCGWLVVTNGVYVVDSFRWRLRFRFCFWDFRVSIECKFQILFVSSEEHDSTITLVVVPQDQDRITFKVRKNGPLKKVFDAYAKHAGIQSHQIRYMYDGKNVGYEDTPKLLEMVDGDEMQVFVQQTGGRLY